MSSRNTKRGLGERLEALRPASIHPQADGDGPRWPLVVYALIAIFALATVLGLLLRAPEPQALSYTDLKQAVRDERVAQVTFKCEQLRGRFTASPNGEAVADGAATTTGNTDEGAGEHDAQGAKTNGLGGHFTSTLPQVQDPALLALLEQHQVEIDAELSGVNYTRRKRVFGF